MPFGEITRLKTESGIGYIREEGTEEDLLFQATSLINGIYDRLRQGQKVEFDRQAYITAACKSRAVNVRLTL